MSLLALGHLMSLEIAIDDSVMICNILVMNDYPLPGLYQKCASPLCCIMHLVDVSRG